MSETKLINQNCLLGYENSDARKGFKWLCRYSDTNTTDKMGRWARICYYNGFQIAWISGYNKEANRLRHNLSGAEFGSFINRQENEVEIYSVMLHFPTNGNDAGGFGSKSFSDLDEAKQFVEQIFLEFKQLIND